MCVQPRPSHSNGRFDLGQTRQNNSRRVRRLLVCGIAAIGIVSCSKHDIRAGRSNLIDAETLNVVSSHPIMRIYLDDLDITRSHDTPDAEAIRSRRGVEVIEKHTGQRPRGWRAPLYNFSDASADLLIEEGFDYDASLMGDDVPYVLRTKGGDLIELPAHWGVDDPAAVEGSDDEKRRTFMRAFSALSTRINLFLNLPMEKLDRLGLKKKLDEIGATRRETVAE